MNGVITPVVIGGVNRTIDIGKALEGNKLVKLKTQTSSYTLGLSDSSGVLLNVNSPSPATVTVPNNSSVALPIGTQVNVGQTGAGQLSFIAASGVTINTAGDSLKLRAINSKASLIKIGTNTWDLVGDLATPDFSHVTNVRQFNVKGDGSTVDVTAIRAALAATRHPFFPRGTYIINDEITVPVGTVIEGEEGTIIRQTALNKNSFIVLGNTTIRGVRLEGLSTGTATDYDKNNGVFINGDNIKISDCVITGFQADGIQIRNSNNVSITNNILYGNKYGFSQSTDIAFYSTSPSKGAIITGNYCLSNNSQGIWFNANGNNSEAIISSNICITKADDGVSDVTMPNLIRRHGIETSYGAGTKFPLIVTGNICGNTRLSGIYSQGNPAPSGRVVITNNNLFKNGQETDFTLCQLGAGIYINTLGGEVVCSNNLVWDYMGVRGGITYNGSYTSTDVVGAIISNNVIENSGYFGIDITNKSRNLSVQGNKITNSARNDISYVGDVLSNGGGLKIIGNTFVRNNHNYQSVFLDAGNQQSPGEVTNNTFIGDDATTATEANAAIRAIQPRWSIKNNKFNNFYYGVFLNPEIQVNGKQNNFTVDFNEFDTLHDAIVIRKDAFSPVYPVFGNVFKNVVNPLSGAGYASAAYIGERNGTLVKYFNTAPPTNGAWQVGDEVVNTAPTSAGVKSWLCTTAGTPGVWTATMVSTPSPSLQNTVDVSPNTTTDIGFIGSRSRYYNASSAENGQIGTSNSILGGTANNLTIYSDTKKIWLGTGGFIRQTINEDGTVEFSLNVSGIAATASNHFVIKSQLDAKTAASNADAASANATDLPSAITLINELKAMINSLQAKLRAATLLTP
ncbi:hypothetical protein SAE01_12740 [Segetibacter aerophilus]|uniref:Rhamnogalacturonase A/B/Epimerase-like pectate lyase domain-containing protein n=2 Tax=Segetibacter aerophilus TaxID=670293 RepID=A0A512BA06_9BACT|nr:hypothetical protein SAE01_12740 [Segetibacter aerophilus]